MGRIIAGRRAVGEALSAKARALNVIYATDSERKPLQSLLSDAKRAGVRIEMRAREELDAVAGEARHQGIVAIAGDYPYANLQACLLPGTGQLWVALDQVQDPHNLGAIVRSAVALGASGVITLRDRACPVTPTVVRASAGATECANIARVTNLARTLTSLRDAGYQTVGLAAEGECEVSELPAADAGRVLVVGSEGQGLRRLVRAQCDVLARIALPGPIASLNASVAAAIAIHACRARDVPSDL